MQVNPMNVLNLLLIMFKAMNLPETPVSFEEQQFTEGLLDVLLDAMTDFITPEYVREDGLGFQEQFKDWKYVAVDDNEEYNEYGYLINENEDEEDVEGKKACSKDNEEVSFEYKKNAVRFWTGCRKKHYRTLKTVQNRYPRVPSIKQLNRWKKHVENNGTHVEKIKNICEFSLKQCKNAMESGFIFHDIDIRRWGLQGKRELGYDELNFKGSENWVLLFKKAHRIVSRKVNKFISKKTFEEADNLKVNAANFVKNITQQMPIYGVENIYNTDESGFQLEMHSGRTLATAGIKKVECVVKSLSATTHSYTIQPIISAAGRLLPKLFIILKEQSGGFGPTVERNLFRPTNVHITASTSGKSTSGK